MKRLKVCGKRAISSMLAAAMLITVFPFSAAAEEGEEKKDITIQWEQVTQEPSDKAAVTLSAGLSADSVVQSATVNIKLTEKEALATTFSEDSVIKLLSPKDQLALLNDGITPITEEEADDDEPEEPAVVEEETDDNKAEESDTTNGQDETDVDETDESGDDVVQDEAGADDPEGSDVVDEGEETAVEETEDSITDSGEEEADNDDPEGSDADAGQDDAGADDPEEPVSETTLISLDQSKTAQMADSEQYWLLTFTLSQPEDVATAPAAASEETAPSARTDVEEGETTDPSKVKADLTFTLPEGARENLKIEITADDISITAKDANGEDVTSASFDIQPLELTLEPEPVPTFPESDQSATIPASGAIPDLSYTLSLDGVEDIDYWLQLTLPEGLALPAGTPTAEETANGTNIVMSAARTAEDGQTDQPEDNVLATVTGLPEGVEINDISVGEDRSTLTFHLFKEQTAAGEEGENEPSTIERIVTALFRSADTVTITINGDKLQRSTANEIKGNATLALYDGDPSGDVEPLNKTSIDITSEILQSEDEVVTDETEYRKEFRKTIIWVDGGEATGRPDMGELFLSFASFTLDGTTYTLNAQTMGLLGLTALPELTVTQIGTNQYTVSYGANTLPSQITTTDDYGNPTTYTVEWNFTPPTVPGYLVETEDSEGEDDTTWYYIHETEFEVTLNLLDGDKDYHLQDNWNKIEDEVLSSFALYTQDGQGDYTATQLSELEGLDVRLNENGTVTLTISGLPMYETSGARINYSIDVYDENAEKPNSPPEGVPDEGDNIKLNVSEDPEDPNDPNDSFSISYNNDHAGGTTTAPDQVYSGGTINLQLTGTTRYSATKQWWDNDSDARPGGEFQLWRYIKGQGVETAEPVRNNGAIVKLEIDGKDEQKLVFTLGGEQTTEENILPKYNGEGYEYIYVVREYLNDSSGYQQIFGKVERETDGSLDIDDEYPFYDENGEQLSRPSNDDFVYDGGTLTNTISEYVTVTANKTWDAAVYQSMLEDVEVTLTLQSRPKVDVGEDENKYDWVNTTTTRELTGFDAESLDARSVSVSMPKYDAQGRELEYRWVESSVQVGESDPVPVKDDKFTIELDGEDVTFISEAEYPDGSDGNTFTTNIKNKIQDTIDYNFTKKWANDTEPKEVYFAIYQYVDEMKNEPYIIFSMDGTNVKIIKPEGQDGDHDGISIKEGSVASKEPSGNLKAEWHVTLENLPEFDEDGRRYEYLILESTGDKDGPWHVNPSLQSSRDETGYTSVITNGGAGGKAIVVQKVWADDSDVEHRSPVTIQVYDQSGNAIAGAEVTLGDKTGEDGEQIWTDIVSIGENDPGNVYVLETQVGETPITYDPPQNPEDTGFVSPEYETKYHRYRVLYDKQTIGSENSTGGTTLFTVTNQRLGNVNVTVDKTWNVGDGEKLKAVVAELKKLNDQVPRLVLQLEFDPNYNNDGYIISRNKEGGDTVTLVEDEPVHIQRPSTSGEQGNVTYEYVSSRQELLSADMFGEGDGQIDTSAEDWVEQLPQTIYFWNLPKYNADGEVVRYTVKELWVDNEGKPVENLPNTLATAYAEFTSTITETEYIAIGEEDGEDGEESSTNRDEYNDKHDFSCVNSLSGTKTVEWHKLWKDQYASGASLRPDLYLDIYQVGYRYENGEAVLRTERITQNYRWYDVTVEVPSEEETAPDSDSVLGEGDTPELETTVVDQNHWRAELQNVPKYDAKGYEYYYYAVEHTSVDYDAIDYYDGQYYAPSDEADELQYVGGKDGPDDTDGDASGEDETSPANPGDWVYPVANETQDGETNAVYGLRESGTFQNGLEGDAVLSAAKQWNSLPEGWPSGQLPTVEFTLYRYPQTNPPADGPEAPEDQKYGEAYATLTINSEDWGNPNSGITVTEGNRYSFNVEYYRPVKPGVDSADKALPSVELNPASDEIDNGEVKLLEKYDDNGNLYVYTLRETKISFETDVDTDVENVYPGELQSSNGSLITNVYKPDTGSIAIRKYLYLPEECFEANGEFPAVKFQLMRLKFGADGEMNKEDEGSWEKYGDPITWTSDQVKAAAGRLNEGESEKLVSEEFIFKDVPIYAPNGKEYTYKVVEVKDDFLEGYDTWAVAGDKSGELESIMDEAVESFEVIITEVTLDPENEEPPTPEDGNTGNGQSDGNGVSTQTGDAGEPSDPDPEESTIKATFINKPIDDTVQLKGEKIWDDFNNAFDLRPEIKEDLKLTVTRSAEAQDGQDNAISETELPEGSYSVTWEEETWTYTITGAENSTGELERYAPNGMPWEYTVEESREGNLQYYTPTPSDGKVTGSTVTEVEGQPTINMPNLTNSMATTLNYQKVWQDQEGEPITENYLGYPVTVQFQVQVRVEEEGDAWSNWQNVTDTFFDKYLTQAQARAMSFEASKINWTPTLTGTLDNTSVWNTPHNIVYKENKVAADLPTVVKDTDGNGFLKLEYRVVETSVTFGNGEQKVTITPDKSDNSYAELTNSNFLDTPTLEVNNSTSTTTNKLKTTKLQVQKKWVGDDDYADITRPTTNNPVTDWEVWFVIQRQVAGEQAWENVTVFRLCGSGNEATGEAFIGLPQCDANGKPYTYQIRELPPNTEGTYTLNTEGNIVDEDGKTVSVIEAGNIFSSGVGWEYTADYTNADGIYTATNTLVTESNPEDPVTTVTVKKNWQPAGEEDEAPAVTVQLQYRTDDSSNWVNFNGQVTLNGDNSWTHTWTNLPDLSEQNVEYQVVETNLDDKYVQLLPIKVEFKPGGDDGSTTFTYTITNVPKTSVHVKKVWLEDTGISHEPITVGLYRTTAGGGEAQPVSDTSGNGNYKLQLTSNNRWSVTFTDLPKCDANGTEYIYSVKEIVDGSALEDGSVFKLNENDYRVDYSADEDGTQIITNTQLTSLSGTKTWVDNSNAYGTRPDDLTLKLYRTTVETPVESDWSELLNLDEEGIVLTIDDSAEPWKYTFTNLPKYDSEGKEYTYKVEESALPGYSGAVDDGDNNEATTNADGTLEGPDFTNTLTGTVNINGTKTWDGGSGSTPILTLQRSTNGTDWETATDNQPNWTGTGSTQTYTYTGLPKYNENGMLYQYRVTETVPGGYDVYYVDGIATDVGDNQSEKQPDTPVKNLDIRNVKRGSLTVSKQVTGNRGDRDQQFDFSVTFTLPTDYNSFDNGGWPTINWTEPDGTEKSSAFTSDTLTIPFTLADDDSITFTNLPGGTTYDVDETNSYGHSTYPENDTGTIPPGGMATAKFVNHRSGGGGGDTPDPDEPDPEIPDEPTPGEDIPPDEPDTPDEPDNPDDPGTDIPDEPTPGEDVPPDEPGADIPDKPTPGGDVPPDDPNTPDQPGKPGLPQTGQLWWPVLLLAAVGAVMSLVGLWNIKRYRGKHGKNKV
ncbi:MAG: Cna B-type domain-containing protein [Clostridiaceae bacterium]|nr:Cna B-type domain-containing protein [Clostridiaceae bacterium]